LTKEIASFYTPFIKQQQFIKNNYIFLEFFLARKKYFLIEDNLNDE